MLITVLAVVVLAAFYIENEVSDKSCTDWVFGILSVCLVSVVITLGQLVGLCRCKAKRKTNANQPQLDEAVASKTAIRTQKKAIV